MLDLFYEMMEIELIEDVKESEEKSDWKFDKILMVKCEKFILKNFQKLKI